MLIDDELLERIAAISNAQVCGQLVVRGISMKISKWLRLPLSKASRGPISTASNVTCCLAFGNDHPYLSQALSSILAQSVRPGRILVGIDNSSIMSHEKQGDIVDIYHFYGRKGPFYIMDALIKMADSEYILVMDSDDISHPYRLELLLKCAIENEAEVVGCSVANFEENGDEISTLGIFPSRPYEALAKGLCHAMLYPTTLVRRRSYLDIGGFSDFDFFGMDTDFIARLAYQGRAINLPLPLYAKRRRARSLTECLSTGMESDRRAKILDYTFQRYCTLYWRD